MEDAIEQLARWGNLVLETVAILVVLFGSAQAVVSVIRVVASGDDKGGIRGRHVWLVYARWLVAGLTFQLAADIVGTSLATSWEEMARLAVMAVVPDLAELFLRQGAGEHEAPAASRDGGAREAEAAPTSSSAKGAEHGHHPGTAAPISVRPRAPAPKGRRCSRGRRWSSRRGEPACRSSARACRRTAR